MKYCHRWQFLTAEETENLKLVDQGYLDQRKLRISQGSIDRMNDFIIDGYNAAAGPNDRLWLIGDVFWGRDFQRMRSLRDRINCQNIILIKGNHDSEMSRRLFTTVHEQTLIKIDGQEIFMNHYPLRSWDSAYDGGWDLYGHVHGLYHEEDCNGMSAKFKKQILTEYQSILVDAGLPEDQSTIDLAIRLLDPWLLRQGINLTLDVGVDCHGYLPWTMDEIRAHFAPRMPRWKARRAGEMKDLHPTASMNKTVSQ